MERGSDRFSHMTTTPTTARPEPDAQADLADVTPMDRAASGPLMLLIGSGILWLLVAGVLGLVDSIQLHSPHFLASYAWLTHGRVNAMAETAFVYGWLANAGLAIGLWVLGRLGGSLLRALNWTFVGALFWNLAVTSGLIGIAAGEMTSFSLLQSSPYVQPLMTISYGAIAISGVLAWMGRRSAVTYAAQWYAVAALFLFPWFSSVAQLVLFWSPLRGVAQSVAVAWHAQAIWSLWLAPLALSVAYYLVPKLSGRVLPLYDFARLGFWVLIGAGSWTGSRNLVGGPVPAWLVTLSITAGVLLMTHVVILVLNLRVIHGVRGTAAGFVKLGLVSYLLCAVLDLVTAFRSIAEGTQFTLFGAGLWQLATYGSTSMIFFGAIYYMVPRLTGSRWASMGLTIGHRILAPLGVVGLVLALSVAGWTQGSDLLNAKTPWGDVFDHMKLPLLIVSAAQIALLSANLLLFVNFLQTIRRAAVHEVTSRSPIALGTEVSVS